MLIRERHLTHISTCGGHLVVNQWISLPDLFFFENIGSSFLSDSAANGFVTQTETCFSKTPILSFDSPFLRAGLPKMQEGAHRSFILSAFWIRKMWLEHLRLLSFQRKSCLRTIKQVSVGSGGVSQGQRQSSQSNLQSEPRDANTVNTSKKYYLISHCFLWKHPCEIKRHSIY